MLDEFRRCLKGKGYHFSQAREIVVNAVSALEGHFGAEELAERLGAGTNRVSRGTVYRTLNLLERFGQIRRVEAGRGARRYEKTGEGCCHEHFYCESCGRTLEFDDPGVDRLLRRACREKGFRMRTHCLTVLGFCAACSREGKKSGDERR